MVKNVVLVGFMGTGKTEVGRLLARELGFEYVDTDDLIEARGGKSIPLMFKEDGEQHFRDLESAAIEGLHTFHDHVIATGGGAVIRDENIRNMKNAGPVICLNATPEVIFERTKDNDYRPLLQTPDPMKKIRDLLEKRASCYNKAGYTIDTSSLSVEEVVDAIIDIIKRL